MKFIKLSQRGTVEHQGEYGWESATVYDPVFIAPDHIESMTSAGLTYIRMASGERIEVRETPEEIIALLAEGAAK
ncbi:flagellar FlbD family protein [Klebsiella michiganensis]|uniref:flagellar FlbD family protein n=1 Tax=Klebsiella michiganensis TaxID=1134687 RepID=UPI003F8D698F